jgi:uncharacterized protein (TIRG00374 family)
VLLKVANIVVVMVAVMLLVAVLRSVDLPLLVEQLRNVGAPGFILVVVVYALSFGADVLSWQMVVRRLDPSLAWFRRLFLVRAVGEAYNNLTPGASMAGEPVKAWLLKRNYGIGYVDSTTSLVLAKTASMAALTVFAFFAMTAVMLVGGLGPTERIYYGSMLATFAAMIFVFVVAQTSGAIGAAAVAASRAGMGPGLSRGLRALRRFDVRIRAFYAREKKRFAYSFVFALAGWLVGVAEMYVIFTFLGYPVSWADALVMEAALQLVRTLAFFVPAGLGAQEVAMVVVAGAITGDPGIGVAAAIVRRSREIFWITASLAFGFRWSLALPWRTGR